MQTIQERLVDIDTCGNRQESILYVVVESDDLLVWNATGHLKMVSFHRPPLNRLRRRDRVKFTVDHSTNQILWRDDGIALSSPFKHENSCSFAHPGTTHDEFIGRLR